MCLFGSPLVGFGPPWSVPGSFCASLRGGVLWAALLLFLSRSAMFVPYTPVEFFDASFRDGSSHTLWCLRVVGPVRYVWEPLPGGFVVPPPVEEFVGELGL